MIFKGFPYIAQYDKMDCGPSCLAMIAQYYGKKYTVQELREYCSLAKDGVSLLGIEDGAREIGFSTMAVQISSAQLIEKKPLPCILHWNASHFVVLYKISQHPVTKRVYFYISDPGYGKIRLTEEQFKENWMDQDKGIALLLGPEEAFYARSERYVNQLTFKHVINFVKPNKREFSIVFFSFLFTSILTLIFPYLTQALIDIGIESANINYITLILMAQLCIFVGSGIIEIVRNWVIMFVNSMINIQLISDFLLKIIRLPFIFFDTKQLSDFSSRIHDHNRIQNFLTSQSLIVVFSSFNLIVYLFVLSFYNIKFLTIFLIFTAGAVIWSLYHLNHLSKIDYHRFRFFKDTQQDIYEIVNGIVEIKLNNSEEYKIGRWKENQTRLFGIDFKTLKISQYQKIGFDLINQLKNILIIFIASKEVVNGNISIGTLVAISYIIGMLNNPLNQAIDFFRSMEYAKLSFKRLNEVQLMDDEEQDFHEKLPDLSQQDTIEIKDLDFHYYGLRSPKVLDNINLQIPVGKTTAIVGESGSGKTTLMKLLLRFYSPNKGSIHFGSIDYSSLSTKDLRNKFGVVMQDGFIFSDTIERNIAVGDKEIDQERLSKAIHIANLSEFIEHLPTGINTTIGVGGNGISGGQKQRILIARAVYKNPDFVIFDEATSALDAENERIIYYNLNEFFKGKTVIIIAHRLSTVKNADQIIVLKKGKIIESGNHKKLIEHKGTYFNLVKNQLELSV